MYLWRYLYLSHVVVVVPHYCVCAWFFHVVVLKKQCSSRARFSHIVGVGLNSEAAQKSFGYLKKFKMATEAASRGGMSLSSPIQVCAKCWFHPTHDFMFLPSYSIQASLIYSLKNVMFLAHLVGSGFRSCNKVFHIYMSTLCTKDTQQELWHFSYDLATTYQTYWNYVVKIYLIYHQKKNHLAQFYAGLKPLFDLIHMFCISTIVILFIRQELILMEYPQTCFARSLLISIWS